MVSGQQIATVLIAVTIAATLLNPIASTVTQNTGTQTVSNETVTAHYGKYTDLDGYKIVSGSETVYNASGATMSSGTDYKIATKNGSIEALNGGSIADGNTIKVSYDYQATDGTTTTVIGLVPLFVGLLMLVVLAAKLMEMM